MAVPDASKEQYFLRDGSVHRAALSQLDLSDVMIIELGMGHGELTELILEQGPKGVIAYEIDASLPNIDDPRLDVRAEDFTRADFSYLNDGNRYALIANPPYNRLGFIRDQLVGAYPFDGVMLMAPQRLQGDFVDYEAMATLGKEAFTPVTGGGHVLLSKGFEHRKELSIPRDAILVLASRNPGKIAELNTMLSATVEVIGLDQLERMMQVEAGSLGVDEESAATFTGNAAIKAYEIVEAIQGRRGITNALTADQRRSLYVVGDDSGANMEGLLWQEGDDIRQGQTRDTRLIGQPFPGVHSKRYVQGFGGTDTQHYQQAFAQIERMKQGDDCRFVCTLSVLHANAAAGQPPLFFTGVVQGRFVHPPQYGSHGFAYDPAFIAEGETRSYAQIPQEEKNRSSHRAIAMAQLVQCITPSLQIDIEQVHRPPPGTHPDIGENRI